MAKILGPFAALTDDDLNQVLELWNKSYPIGICYQDLDELKSFLAPLGQKRHYLIRNGRYIKAWIVSFDRDRSRWFSIIIDEDFQSKGLGKTLLLHVQNSEPELNGWVVDHNNDLKKDGTPYKSPLRFYLKLGFNVDESQRYEKPGISCVRVFSS